ncbi:hypothetical protein J6590_050520 [Homalodisca vitripennis]|nr:hypothetical protein J6590_050520 [Homalodisca vitripennis]
MPPLPTQPVLLLLPPNDFSLGLGGVLNGWHHHDAPREVKVTLIDTRRRKKTVRFDGPQTKDSGIDTSSTFTSSEDSNSAPKVPTRAGTLTNPRPLDSETERIPEISSLSSGVKLFLCIYRKLDKHPKIRRLFLVTPFLTS